MSIRSLRQVLPALLLLFHAVPGAAQGIQRAGWARPFLGRAQHEGYLNYAIEKYKTYRIEIASHKRFDALGNYVNDGYFLWGWDEYRPGMGEYFPVPEDGSLRTMNIFWRGTFNAMVQADDVFKDWQGRLTVGDQVRARFTSFTLDLPRYTGVRLDVSSPRNALTLLYTRGWTSWRFDIDRKPGGGPITATAGLGESTWGPAASPVPFFGAHWQTQIGDALTLSATFVNQHAEDVTRAESIASVRGTLPYPMRPSERVILTFADDSPQDGRGGAAVFGMPEVRVLAEGDSVLTRFVPAVFGGRVVDGHREANGFDELSFTYDMPLSPIPVAMEIGVVVANDYEISVSQAHTFFNPFTKQVDAEGHKVEFEDRETFSTVIDRAEGNVQDFSNRRRIRFRYGFNTGQTIYGANISGDLAGLEVEGEIALSSTYQQFPTFRGERLSPQRGTAYFLNVLKSFGRYEVGAEYFHVGPRYAGYHGSRGGPTLYTDNGGISRDRGIAVEFPWVEDNDDRDQWSDDDQTQEIFGRGSAPWQPNLDAGVYPGRDVDQDGIIDDDRNSNAVPDWTEPFLLYHSDPIDFVYGYDNNNNGWIDEWEDDEQPDYRYDKDLEGPHVFAAVKPLEDLRLVVGMYDNREVAGGGRNEGRYLRVSYRYDVGRYGGIEFNHDTKRVKDDIRNSVYVFPEFPRPVGPQPGDPGYDTLEMRNSVVHTTWLGTRYTQMPNLNVENNIKILQNHRLETDPLDGVPQKDVRRTTFTIVNRADYKLVRGPWTLWPQFKLMTLFERRNPRVGSGLTVRSQRWTVPILKVDYTLSGNTKLRFGSQGVRFPLLNGLFDRLGLNEERARNVLAFQLRDHARPSESYSSSRTVFMLQNFSSYFGYPFYASIGVQRVAREFRSRASRFRDARFNILFIELVSGYQ